MLIKEFDINDAVTVSCTIGEIAITDSYESIGYFKVSGEYKPGSAGREDAEHIVGMIAYAQRRYFNRRWLFDFSELSYVWGDEMDWVLEFGGGDELVALVLGPNCMPAISTLSDPNASPEECLKEKSNFTNIQEAYDYLLTYT